VGRHQQQQQQQQQQHTTSLESQIAALSALLQPLAVSVSEPAVSATHLQAARTNAPSNDASAARDQGRAGEWQAPAAPDKQHLKAGAMSCAHTGRVMSERAADDLQTEPDVN
jgi:hypothetical protein